MSFILDALKKSESERQRQSGPALFEVKIAPPRSRFATWGIAIAALLAINFIVVGFVLWRGSASRASTSAAAGQSGAVSAAPEALSAGSRYGVRTEAGAAPSAASPPTAVATVPASANAAASSATLDVGAAAGRFGATAAASPSSGGVAPGSTPPVAAQSAEPGVNPDDLAPAVEPPAQPETGAIRATENGLPTYQDAAAEPGANIPSLKLDLHVYSPLPDQRFVFLNMLKLREGDTSPQGVHVDHITQDGVILSYRGKEFVLQRP